jgi:hypothetical protein
VEIAQPKNTDPIESKAEAVVVKHSYQIIQKESDLEVPKTLSLPQSVRERYNEGKIKDESVILIEIAEIKELPPALIDVRINSIKIL